MTSSRRALVLALAAASFAPATASADGDGTIKVSVSTFKNQKGFLGCRLFRVPEQFPDGTGAAQRMAIAGPSTTCTFEHVEPGTYAVTAIHDENGNGKLDRDFFGIPAEGYGVSNNHTYTMSAPRWDESKFTVEPGETKTLTVSLRY
ncbi:MAG: DUF2141 domain-containing protein [Polyangiales bacterium]